MKALTILVLLGTVCLAASGQAPARVTTTSAPATAPSAEAKQAWQKLFAAEPPSGAAEAVLAACGHDADRLRALIAADAAYAALDPGWHQHRLKVADGKTEYDVTFVVRVPRGYDPARPWPLILAAHGQGSSGSEIGETMEWLLGRDRDRYVLVAPNMPGPTGYSGKPYQEQAFLKPLAWVRRNLHIDPDRVFVAGYSQGGHCTWHLAVMYPWLFAAAVPMAGVPCFEGSPYTSTSYMENLSNLPVWAIWGEKDKVNPAQLGSVDISRLAAKRLKQLGNDLFTGTEVRGGGHDDCTPPPAEFVRYLAGKKRPPPPAKVAHFFHLPAQGRGYYLEAVKLSRPPMDFSRPQEIRLNTTTPPVGQEETLAAVAAQVDKQLFKLWGELDRPSNALTVKASGVAAVRVYVTEGMFDLTRPVTLRFAAPLDPARADKTWTGRIPRSARCALTRYADDRDGSAILWNEVEIDAAGKVTARYE